MKIGKDMPFAVGAWVVVCNRCGGHRCELNGLRVPFCMNCGSTTEVEQKQITEGPDGS